MSEEKKPSVIRFEQEVAQKNYEQACFELLDILEQLDSNFGGIQNIEIDIPSQLNNLEYEQVTHFCTRMAVGITALFSDHNLVISDGGTLRFLTLQRWISFIFASSPYINADHILQEYNLNPNKKDLLEKIKKINERYEIIFVYTALELMIKTANFVRI